MIAALAPVQAGPQQRPGAPASPDERGAVIACYYAVAYLGFAVPT
jgi:hypothetical protein